jgi:Trypsin-like peptidase domain
MAGPVDVISTCTVRIVGSRGGVSTSIGTGFLYAVEAPALPSSSTDPTLRFVPLLVTNKHVVDGCDEISVQFTLAPLNAAIGSDGQPVGKIHEAFRMPVAGVSVGHPNADVDLCGFPVAGFLNLFAARGMELRHHFLNPSYKPDPALRSILRAIEPIAMVGYPSGIWDSVNNAAIVRRGSTATHPLVRYENKPEFLIDAACFPGSSGSPVFLFEDGMYRTAGDGLNPGTRIAFLGVLYAGPQFTAEGRLEPRPIPHNVTQAPVTSFPMNLGFVIQSDQIDILAAEFLRRALVGGTA